MATIGYAVESEQRIAHNPALYSDLFRHWSLLNMKTLVNKIPGIVALIHILLLLSCSPKVGDTLPELFLLDGLFPPGYTISGRVSGLTGTLPLQLTDTASGDKTEVSGNGLPADYEFTLNGIYRTLDPYSIDVTQYPESPLQVCKATNETGQVINNDILNLSVECDTAYRLYPGLITGVAGSGLTLVNNGVNFQQPYSDTFAVDSSMNGILAGTYYFSEPIGVGGDYDVSIASQPTNPWQTCSFSASTTATSVSADTTLPDLTCTTDDFELSVTAVNLQYPGLEVTLATNGGAAGTPVTLAPGSLTRSFGMYPSGTDYTLDIASPVPGQTCSVSGSPGKIGGGNVNVLVLCEDPTGYPVAGKILGSNPYLGSGLELTLTITHLDSSQTTTTVNPAVNSPGSDSSFVFPIALVYGEDYSVSITSQPTGVYQDCDFNGGGGTTTASGTSVSGLVTLPDITCFTRSFQLSGSVSGAPASAAVSAQLYINGTLAETASSSYDPGSGNFTFSFTGLYDSGSTYKLVPVTSNALKCAAGGGNYGGGAGIIRNGDVTNLVISCEVRYVYTYYMHLSILPDKYVWRYGSLSNSASEGALKNSANGVSDMVSFPDGSDWIYTLITKTAVLYTTGSFNTVANDCNSANYVANQWIVYTCYIQYGATDWNYQLYSQKADGSSGEVALQTSTAVNSRYTTLIPGATPRIAWVETTEPADDTPIVKACDFDVANGTCATAPVVILNADANRTGIQALTTSPDGARMLIAASYASAPEWTIYEWTIGNPTATPGAGMTPLTPGTDPAYHPLGKGFLFGRLDPYGSIFYYDLTSGTEQILKSGGSSSDCTDPSFYFKPD